MDVGKGGGGNVYRGILPFFSFSISRCILICPWPVTRNDREQFQASLPSTDTRRHELKFGTKRVEDERESLGCRRKERRGQG